MLNICYDIIVPDPSTFFYYVMWLYDHDSIIVWQFVMVTCDVTLDPNPSSK